MAQISIGKALEELGGTVGLSASDLHAAGFQYSVTYGADWEARLIADLQGRKTEQVKAAAAEASALEDATPALEEDPADEPASEDDEEITPA